MENTKVGNIFCSAIDATMFDGIMSMKNFIQSTDTAMLPGTLPVAANGAPAPGWKTALSAKPMRIEARVAR
jgi:hypothetical protein